MGFHVMQRACAGPRVRQGGSKGFIISICMFGDALKKHMHVFKQLVWYLFARLCDHKDVLVDYD